MDIHILVLLLCFRTGFYLPCMIGLPNSAAGSVTLIAILYPQSDVHIRLPKNSNSKNCDEYIVSANEKLGHFQQDVNFSRRDLIGSITFKK